MPLTADLPVACIVCHLCYSIINVHTHISFLSLFVVFFITSNQLIQVFFVSLLPQYPSCILPHSAISPPHFFVNISVVLYGHGRSPDIAYTFGRILPTITHTYTCIYSCIIYILICNTLIIPTCTHTYVYKYIHVYITHNMYIHINKPKNCPPVKCFQITIAVRFVPSQTQNPFIPNLTVTRDLFLVLTSCDINWPLYPAHHVYWLPHDSVWSQYLLSLAGYT